MTPTTHKKDAPPQAGHPPLVVDLGSLLELTDERLLALSSLNRDLRMERTESGELIVMPPTGGDTSGRNAEIIIQLGTWAKGDGTGKTFDSSGGFRLPNGAVRSPDASWVANSRLDTLTEEQRKKFIPLCPDFVIELRSPSDSLTVTQDKMQEYLDNGAKLGWLIDPEQHRVYVYRPDAQIQELDAPKSLSADPVLPDFTLGLREIL